MAALNLFGGRSGVGVGPAPAPTTSPSPTLTPTTAPSASPDPLDTATWTTYVSERYGFSIAHPADWAERPSNHLWTLAKDAAVLPESGAADEFILTTDNLGIRVSVWSVPVAPGITLDAWLQTYCLKNTTPCTGIQSRAIALTMDGHPGTLVPFKDDVQSFFLVDSRIYVIACWRPEADQSVLPYSGSQRFLETFLSTMRLLPGGPAPSATTTPRPGTVSDDDPAAILTSRAAPPGGAFGLVLRARRRLLRSPRVDRPWRLTRLTRSPSGERSSRRARTR